MESARVYDVWPDDLQFLLGDDVDELFGEYVAARGGRFLGARPMQVAHRPGRSTTVQFRIELESDGGATTTETHVVAVGRRPVDGATILKSGSQTASVWEWRHDPALPGLDAALDRSSVRALLDDLGVGGGDVGLRVRAYRPGRRAVVEADDGTHRLFLKVVRPDRVESLHRLHRRLAETLPVPNSIGWSDRGVMVLPPIQGETLRDALRRGSGVPGPAAIRDLMARFPVGVGHTTRRPGWLDEARRHGGVIEATVPGVQPILGRTLDRLAACAAGGDLYETVTVHGDLYESQLMVAGGNIVGLLDVDTVGVGHRIDDVANFCAHLSVLALVWPQTRRLNRYGAELLAAAECCYGRRALRTRIAAATLGLATGSFRTLEANWIDNTMARIDLANRWIDGAEKKSPA